MGALVLSLPGCGGGDKGATTVQQAKVLVKTAPVEKRMINEEVEFTANIEPYKKNYVTPAVSGVRIDRILVDVGDRVRKGQLLVEMDPVQYDQQMVQLMNQQADYNRIKAVYEAGGVSKQELDQAETQLEIQQKNVDNLKKNIRLVSPIDGVVTARNSEEGNLFDNQPVLELMQIDRLKVMAALSEQYFSKVKVGMPVAVTVDIYPGETFEGRVSLIYPALDPQTRTFQVEVTIPNGNGRLRPGMFSRSIFNMGEKEGLMVPDVAVQRQAGTNDRFVYVIKDSVAEYRRVKTGRQVASEIDLLSGVSEGEEVALTSFTKLDDGTLVQIKND